MRVDDRGRLAGQRTVTTFQASTDVTAEYDGLLQRRRSQRRNRAAALAVSAVVAVLAILSVQANLAAGPQPQPMQPEPTPDVGGVPVWYDEDGLHRGNVVEQTPAKVQSLALVQTGALYLTPATGEVWFHPWGRDPRIVGHDVIAGPGGDPEGVTAAWFEASELVVYDTEAGRVVSRTVQSHPMLANCLDMCAEHYPAGSNFLQVSAERLVWISGAAEDAYSHDVSTGKTSEVEAPVIDVHDDALVTGDYSRNSSALILSTPGRAEGRYPDLEPRARLSPNGDYVLAVEGSKERHGATIIEIRTGDLWRVGGSRYPWIAWSYGDIALVDTEDALLACDAGRRICKRLPATRGFLMPTT